MRLLLLIVLLGIPSFAQNDFVGEWAARYHEDQTERIAGPDIGDYLGIPLNDAARLRADSWDASILTLPEWQCHVISTGDIFTTTGYPFIDLARGGSIQGEIDALNRILDLAIPAGKEEGGTYIVPGHGRLCDEADVAYYRDMVTIIRDRILSLKKKGMTLEQVKAARPTSDYDPRYGSADRFIEAIYKSLR